MKIVVLDGYTLNPGDLSWEWLKGFGQVAVYDRTSYDDILGRAAGATVILTNKTPLDGIILNQLPDLKYIGVLATGYNIIDTTVATKNGIIVANAPAYGTASVVQMTFALLLELCVHTQKHSDSVSAGKWARSLDFCYWDFPLVELAGKTMGIIGFGEIGDKVSHVAAALGMHVIGASRRQTDQSHRNDNDFRWVGLPELFAKSDVVSIHCPLTSETKGMINTASLQNMKRSAFLINTSRGPIIDEQDLADALNNGIIAGAGLDVLSVEPPNFENPLFKARNCIITPHIAWATKEARTRLMEITISNLTAFIAGKPVNVINNK